MTQLFAHSCSQINYALFCCKFFYVVIYFCTYFGEINSFCSILARVKKLSFSGLFTYSLFQVRATHMAGMVAAVPVLNWCDVSVMNW